MTRPMIGVVVVNYNGGDLTLRCLDSLRALDWPADRLRIVLVDNASTDGIADQVLAERPDVDVIKSPTNDGFAGGCNAGIDRLSDVDYVALLNNDAVAEPGWLAPLVDALEADPGLGAANSKVLLDGRFVEVEGRRTDVINSAGVVLVEGGYGADRAYLEPDDGQYDEEAEVFAWSGSAVLLSRRYLRDVGAFEDEFFLYYEDFDLSWRGRLAGWRYRYIPESVVRHVHGASSGAGEGSPLFRHYNERNRLLTLTRNAPRGLALRAPLRSLLITLSYTRRDVVSPLLHGHRPRTDIPRWRTRALAAYVRQLPWAVAGRRRIRRNRSTPDEEILAWMEADKSPVVGS